MTIWLITRCARHDYAIAARADGYQRRHRFERSADRFRKRCNSRRTVTRHSLLKSSRWNKAFRNFSHRWLQSTRKKPQPLMKDMSRDSLNKQLQANRHARLAEIKQQPERSRRQPRRGRFKGISERHPVRRQRLQLSSFSNFCVDDCPRNHFRFVRLQQSHHARIQRDVVGIDGYQLRHLHRI